MSRPIHIPVSTADKRLHGDRIRYNYLPRYPFGCGIANKLTVLLTIEVELGVKCVESFREVPRSEYLYLWRLPK